MKNEIIDHLDENENIIGIIDKEIAHENGLWHKSVHVWIINDNNEILLQQRCKDKDFFPNVWDASFAGHVSAGENSITSAIREGEEELGIEVDAKNMEYLFTNKESLIYNDITSNEFVDIYLLRQNINLKDIILQKEEVSKVKYVSINEFFQMVEEEDKTLFPHINEYEELKKYLFKRTK